MRKPFFKFWFLSLSVITTVVSVKLIAAAQAVGVRANVSDIGIDEKLGDRLPLDLSFRDENGGMVSLGQLINKPAVISLVYYSCPGICTPLLNGLREVIERMPSKPGKDFNVLTISFNDQDTPAVALEKKKNYIAGMKTPAPDDAWRFLTGDNKNISGLTNAVGFRFKRDGKDFVHPASLIVVSKDGRITRYLYGVNYLPFDMEMALTEASEGRIGTTIRRTLLFCFSYDPKGRKYMFNILRVSGTVIIISALSFFAFLIYLTRKQRLARE